MALSLQEKLLGLSDCHFPLLLQWGPHKVSDLTKTNALSRLLRIPSCNPQGSYDAKTSAFGRPWEVFKGTRVYSGPSLIYLSIFFWPGTSCLISGTQHYIESNHIISIRFPSTMISLQQDTDYEIKLWAQIMPGIPLWQLIGATPSSRRHFRIANPCQASASGHHALLICLYWLNKYLWFAQYCTFAYVQGTRYSFQHHERIAWFPFCLLNDRKGVL